MVWVWRVGRVWLFYTYTALGHPRPRLGCIRSSSARVLGRRGAGLFAGRCGDPLLTGSTAFAYSAGESGGLPHGALPLATPWSNRCASARRLWARRLSRGCAAPGPLE